MHSTVSAFTARKWHKAHIPTLQRKEARNAYCHYVVCAFNISSCLSFLGASGRLCFVFVAYYGYIHLYVCSCQRRLPLSSWIDLSWLAHIINWIPYSTLPYTVLSCLHRVMDLFLLSCSSHKLITLVLSVIDWFLLFCSRHRLIFSALLKS